LNGTYNKINPNHRVYIKIFSKRIHQGIMNQGNYVLLGTEADNVDNLLFK